MNEKPVNTVIYTEKTEYKKSAELLSKRLNLDLVKEPGENSAILKIDENGLSLIDGGLQLRGDFTRLIPRIKQNNLTGELIIKAAKIKSFGNFPTAVDATAGLGEDSFLLAAAGFNVTLYEKNPIIAALVSDALERAKKIPEIKATVNRMTFFEGNSINAFKSLSFSPDLILLDPMFPKRQKSSMVKKKLQLIQLLESPCSDEAELINAAIAANPKKIIIKRPANGPYLGGIKPSYSTAKKNIRFDCIVFSEK